MGTDLRLSPLERPRALVGSSDHAHGDLERDSEVALGFSPALPFDGLVAVGGAFEGV